MAINDNTAKWRVKKLGNIIGSNGYWQPNEEVKVGTIRFPMGEDNIGYVLECVEAGTTGEEQPTLIGEELANYAEVGRVGQVRVIFNLAEKDVDEVMAMGVTYSRLTYPELWEWAGKRAGLIISEEEWQAKFAETNGKFVPYYSSGDGSSTFRTPLLGAYLKGAESGADVGKYVDAGLPTIEGQFDVRMSENGYYAGIHNTGGCFYSGGNYAQTVISNSVTTTQNNGSTTGYFNASRSNPIYGNSDTVTPETMTGVWVIKAVGVVVDSGETDIANVLTATEQVQERLSVVEDTKANLGALSMPSGNSISLNLTATDQIYIAPCDGYFCATFKRGNASTFACGIKLTNGNSEYWVYLRNNETEEVDIVEPVAKGTKITTSLYAGNTTGNTISDVYFVYAQSEV